MPVLVVVAVLMGEAAATLDMEAVAVAMGMAGMRAMVAPPETLCRVVMAMAAVELINTEVFVVAMEMELTEAGVAVGMLMRWCLRRWPR